MADYTHAPAAATAATKTVAAVTGVVHEIIGIEWSYDAAPTGGNLKIESPSGTAIFQVDITAAGPGQFNWDTRSKKGAVGQDVIVTLASGAGAVVGKLNFSTR